MYHLLVHTTGILNGLGLSADQRMVLRTVLADLA